MNTEKELNKIFFLKNINILIDNSMYIKNKSQLARKIGISDMAFSSMAKRGTSPSIDIAKKCATFFNLTLDDILYKDLSTEFCLEAITIPVYKLDDLKEPTSTITIPLNISPDVFAISITQKDSIVFANDVFILSKDSEVINYDYVLLKHCEKHYIKQIIFKDLAVFFANIDNIEDIQIIEDYTVIGKVVTKVIS
jgi:DNA-binding XRE family transcriptional regulator